MTGRIIEGGGGGGGNTAPGWVNGSCSKGNKARASLGFSIVAGGGMEGMGAGRDGGSTVPPCGL